jgi:methionyl-tRNA formyltransferase
MAEKHYVVVTIKSWNIKVYNDVIKHYPGKWHLFTETHELTVDRIKKINPKYIFFPHWSNIVPDEILNTATCICFHETDLPFGRGGSPLQNLIELGYKETAITAFKMTSKLDAGPVFLKKDLSLEGLAEEIFLRSAYIVAEMIKTIITSHPEPQKQVGKPTYFMRRKKNQSKIPLDKNELIDIFDHIRMLDAEGYPKAFFEIGNFRYEISRPALKTNEIIADLRITKIDGDIHYD